MSAELGSMLVKAGKISQEQLERAQAYVKNKKTKFEQALVGIGAFTSEDEISFRLILPENSMSLRYPGSAKISLSPSQIRIIFMFSMPSNS
jgi:hypothetical protein